MSTQTYTVEGVDLREFDDLAERLDELPEDPEKLLDLEVELGKRMEPEGPIGIRVEMVPALVALIKRQKSQAADWKALAQNRLLEYSKLIAQAKRFEAQGEQARLVLLKVVEEAGGKIKAGNPQTQGFKSIYIKTPKRAAVVGTCHAHGGFHIEGPDCLDHEPDCDMLPEELVKTERSPRKAEIKKHLKACDPLDMPDWGALVDGKASVVVLG